MTRNDIFRVSLITAGALAGVVLLWMVRTSLLLAFASIVVAVLLTSAVDLVRRYLPLTRSWSLLVVVLVLIAGLSASILLVGSRIQLQVTELFHQLPQALEVAEAKLGVELPDVNQSGRSSLNFPLQELLPEALSIGRTAANAITGLVVVIVGGVFLAADPNVYITGLVKLFPRSYHPQLTNCIDEAGNALRLWLIGELISMTIVGVLVGLGIWLIGLPAPIALGLFAGLMEFIPTVGPIIGAIPALLLAIGQGSTSVLWTIGLFVALQQAESNIITPVVQRNMVNIPPALLLFSVVVAGLLFGILGVVLAAPLTVVIYVAVKTLYVRRTLGIETSVPSE
jgi:predicted PurR-regulated permease PerM